MRSAWKFVGQHFADIASYFPSPVYLALGHVPDRPLGGGCGFDAKYLDAFEECTFSNYLRVPLTEWSINATSLGASLPIPGSDADPCFEIQAIHPEVFFENVGDDWDYDYLNTILIVDEASGIPCNALFLIGGAIQQRCASRRRISIGPIRIASRTNEEDSTIATNVGSFRCGIYERPIPDVPQDNVFSNLDFVSLFLNHVLGVSEYTAGGVITLELLNKSGSTLDTHTLTLGVTEYGAIVNTNYIKLTIPVWDDGTGHVLVIKIDNLILGVVEFILNLCSAPPSHCLTMFNGNIGGPSCYAENFDNADNSNLAVSDDYNNFVEFYPNQIQIHLGAERFTYADPRDIP